jgi:hypothetical protein
MANTTIQLKRSSVAGKTPNTSTLNIGELALNLTDKKLYSSDGSTIFEPAGNVTNLNITGGLKANGSYGTNGYLLKTNGSEIYWTAAPIGAIPSNIRNIVNTSVNTIASVIDTANASGISTIEYVVSARDNINNNYKSSRLVIASNGSIAYIMEYGIVSSNDFVDVCNFSTDITGGNIRLLATGDSVDTDVSLQRVVLGSSTEAGDIAASVIVDSVTNTAINVSASANSVKSAYDTAITAYSNAAFYTDAKIATANTAMVANAAAAYTNAVAYTDSRIIDSVTNTSISYAASANSAKNAYDRAIDANTRAASAQTAAASAYTNATSYADTKSDAAYSNAVSYVDTKIGTANTAITGNAAAAYSNATTFSSNADNITSGTVAEARLPYRMNQNVRTSDSVEFAGMTLTGNLVVSGNVNIIGSNNLSISDNMIYLNSNNDVSNPDIGFAGNYNDGTYHHAGFFRDASDGVWKVFDNYLPEPDASVYIDTTNTSFHLADFQANTVAVGNSSVNAVINSTAFTGTSNNSNYLGGIAAANYVNTSGSYTITGIHTYNANISISSTADIVIDSAAGISANGSFGTSGQALTTNGTAVYWSTIVGTNTDAQYTWSNTQTFSNVITFNANIVIGSTGDLVINAAAGISANGTLGTSGQVLTTNGTAVYWSTASAGVNLASSYAFTNTTASGNATSGAITTAGGLGVANNIYAGGRIGFSNSTNISVGYFQYNATTGSIDLVFG